MRLNILILFLIVTAPLCFVGASVLRGQAENCLERARMKSNKVLFDDENLDRSQRIIDIDPDTGQKQERVNPWAVPPSKRVKQPANKKLMLEADQLFRTASTMQAIAGKLPYVGLSMVSLAFVLTVLGLLHLLLPTVPARSTSDEEEPASKETPSVEEAPCPS